MIDTGRFVASKFSYATFRQFLCNRNVDYFYEISWEYKLNFCKFARYDAKDRWCIIFYFVFTNNILIKFTQNYNKEFMLPRVLPFDNMFIFPNMADT